MSSSQQCPGMSRRFWKPKDVNELTCRNCGKALEFWKDDVKVKCECGTVTFNPKLSSLCLSWCDKAVECLGNMDIEEWKAQMKTEGKKTAPSSVLPL